MNNEPVAWLSPDNFYVCPEAEYEIKITTEHPKDLGWLPLYTHPAKTLTDEEIWEVINRTAWVGTEEEIRFKIAEAILRKAQEK
jgi:hypothetical protein